MRGGEDGGEMESGRRRGERGGEGGEAARGRARVGLRR